MRRPTLEPKADDPILVRWRILARDYAARPAFVDRGSSPADELSCGNQPAYISVIDRRHIRTRFSVPAMETIKWRDGRVWQIRNRRLCKLP